MASGAGVALGFLSVPYFFQKLIISSVHFAKNRQYLVYIFSNKKIDNYYSKTSILADKLCKNYPAYVVSTKHMASPMQRSMLSLQ